MNTADFLVKKLAHMTVYAVLYLLLLRAFHLVMSPTRNSRYWWLPLAACLVYAVSDETHQGLVGGSRSPSARDVGYDMLGALLIWLKQYKYV